MLWYSAEARNLHQGLAVPHLVQESETLKEDLRNGATDVGPAAASCQQKGLEDL
jgi:hypothetical protein